MLIEYVKKIYHQIKSSHYHNNKRERLLFFVLFYFLGVISNKPLHLFCSYFKLLLYTFVYKILRYKNSEDFNGEYKLVLCVRTDLCMGKGKIAAQCGHASIGAYADSVRNNNPYVYKWFNDGQKKVVLKINDYDEMREIKKQAKLKGVNTHVTIDAGRTQIPSGSCTVIAVGPGPEPLLDKITGHLKLL
ncbi:Peptidyl-tRNA hydrolase PTH2 family protein [Theileria parva strain Muguga]|uniref:Peptidyl-tRNA hydrolase PTH2 family protein n=1 Tax=Theileria parva strain Muguga TaxID=333668 RepID=UPI001C61C340|nr:Peptidyl-tRNA hydrolase PTH2 family protein [Theileria parva strain Muguga]EAN34097.2 Peptidyl-tRNA hydrolase PTH2 family protein [Theileria parva strain Muguga]